MLGMDKRLFRLWKELKEIDTNRLHTNCSLVMAESWDGSSSRHSCDTSRHSGDSYHAKLHIEPIYESFVCPLTKQIMQDPVTIETGHTFEREAIEKWFKECNESGRRPFCPLTLKELNSIDLNSSIALRHTIEEWIQRNEAAQLENTCKSLGSGSFESDILHSLDYVVNICQKSRSNKHLVRNAECIPLITDMLKNSSRKVRCKALQTLLVVAEDNDDNKEVMAAGTTIRTIVKFLSHDHTLEREAAVSLLYELSKSDSLCEKIGVVNGAILILVGLASSKSENVITVEKAEKILENLEKFEKNVRQMAENGRLKPLLTLLLNGSPETQLSMAAYLGELVLSNEVKVFVAETAGFTLVDVMRRGTKQAREAALKALNQVSSHEASAKILIQAGILPPLVQDLFTVGVNQLPMKLKEVSASVLANIVASGAAVESIPLDQDNQTIVSEDVVHNLLHLISNTGPAIECKLLQVLVGLTSSSTTVLNIVSAIKSSGATISLIQFIETPQRDIRTASIKLLHNLSPYMAEELSDALQGTAGQLGSLVRVISENNGITEEQASAIGVLAELPEGDSVLTRRLLSEETFPIMISKVLKIRHGGIRGGRFVTPYLEGLVRVLSRITYLLENEPGIISLVQEYNLTALFIDLVQTNGIDKVQMVSAMALKNLSRQSKNLKVTVIPEPVICTSIFSCFNKQPDVSGLCRVHRGLCSIRGSFCLVEGKAVKN
ncbi:hypothetical protein HPP92_021834 [Vanilla planifolia]|uniref:RING-type E3 ubiquitin transferase n=1 Tax=Vanilla planifolia TaxID=51239 RepID=A0A835PR46_VANPL|nr:hypothetical protein HPP92_021834 [Vanilla planifolia]